MVGINDNGENKELEKILDDLSKAVSLIRNYSEQKPEDVIQELYKSYSNLVREVLFSDDFMRKFKKDRAGKISIRKWGGEDGKLIFEYTRPETVDGKTPYFRIILPNDGRRVVFEYNLIDDAKKTQYAGETLSIIEELLLKKLDAKTREYNNTTRDYSTKL